LIPLFDPGAISRRVIALVTSDSLVLRSGHDREARVLGLLGKYSKSKVRSAIKLDKRKSKFLVKNDDYEDAATNERSQSRRCVVIVVVRRVLCLICNGEDAS
jgi:hypothetical protein